MSLCHPDLWFGLFLFGAIMSNLTVFNFEAMSVRVIDQDGEPWFVLRDVLKAMGSSVPVTTAKASIVEGLGDGYVKTVPIQTQGGAQQITIVNESGLLHLLIRSNSPSARNARLSIIKQISDVRSVLNALNDFEVPDDLPDMYVYAIRECDTGNIKLGISRDPEQRLKQMQTGNSSRLELVGYREAKNRFKDESALHFKAADYRIRGEWFNHNAMGVMQ